MSLRKLICLNYILRECYQQSSTFATHGLLLQSLDTLFAHPLLKRSFFPELILDFSKCLYAFEMIFRMVLCANTGKYGPGPPFSTSAQRAFGMAHHVSLQLSVPICCPNKLPAIAYSFRPARFLYICD